MKILYIMAIGQLKKADDKIVFFKKSQTRLFPQQTRTPH